MKFPRVAARSLFALSLVCASPVLAQETESGYQARTVPDEPAAVLELDPAVLRTQVRPLSREEALVELDAWIGVVEKKAYEVRDAELAALAAEGAEKGQATEKSVALRAERDRLIKNAGVVVEAAERKGGDVEEADQYLDSIVALPTLDGVATAWATLRAWLVSPDGGIAMAISIGKFLATLIAFTFLAGLLGGLMQRALLRIPKTSELLRSFLVNSVRKVTVFLGIVIALSMLGVNIGPFVAVIGAAGFVLGFALQGTLSNFASGVMIMLYRPYDIGDVVTAAGVTGQVDSMTLVSTSIKTPDNQTIVVPNGSIWGGVITNITANDQRRVDMTFGIGYGDDIKKAKELLAEVVSAHPLVLAEPAPMIRVHELGESSVNLIVRPWAKTSDYWDVYWDLHQTVKERFDAGGISIPFPQRDVHLHQAPVSV